MISRLLLVSFVGVLGFSLPDGVDWGIVSSQARSEVIRSSGPAPGPESREAKLTAFEPISVEDVSINRLADELNRRSEGLDLTIVTAVSAVPALPHAENMKANNDAKAVERLFAENRVFAEPANKATDEAERLFAENRVFAEPTDKATDAVERLFAENRVFAEPATEIKATAAEDRPAFAPIAPVETISSLADELNRASEGLDIDPASIVVASHRPRFEPIPVAEPASKLVDDLNRASEGTTAARQEPANVSTALRLTRDAALAWMNVLARDIPATKATR
ncbi:MAG: hypothetical protein ACYC61_07355 [Isosphaeraceae bacterium]